MYRQLINSQGFTSIQEAQAGLTRLFKEAGRKKNFLRVLKNNKPLGVLVPDRVWESLLEDLEALSSAAYLREVKEAREGKKRYSAVQVKKVLEI